VRVIPPFCVTSHTLYPGRFKLKLLIVVRPVATLCHVQHLFAMGGFLKKCKIKFEFHVK
jgi:hypothetical protein